MRCILYLAPRARSTHNAGYPQSRQWHVSLSESVFPSPRSAILGHPAGADGRNRREGGSLREELLSLLALFRSDCVAISELSEHSSQTDAFERNDWSDQADKWSI